MSNVAEIGVRVTADATRLMSGLQKALDAIDNFGNKFQRAANKVAAVGAAITALGSKMIADAAKYDRNVKGAVDGLAKAYDNLAVRIGAALIPAINAVTEFLARLIRAWDSLSPSQRRAIADIAEMTAKALVFVGVAGAVVGIVGDLAGLAAVMLPVLPPLLAVAAALAGIALLLGAGYGAWKEYGDGISKAVKTALDSAKDFASNYFDFMVDNLRSLANFWIDLAKTIVDTNKTLFATLTPVGLAGGKNPILESAGGALDAISSRINGPSGIGASIAAAGEKLKAGVAAATDAAKDGIKDSFKNFLEVSGLGEWVDRFDRMFDAAGTGFANKIGEAVVPWENWAGRGKASGPQHIPELLGGAAKDYGGHVASNMPGNANAAARAAEAPGAWEQIKGAGATFARNFGETMGAAGGIIKDAVLAAAPKFGAMVQGAMQGGAAGGPLGALAGAVAALLTQTRAFGIIVSQVEEGMSMLVEFVNPLLKPLIALGKITNGLIKVLSVVTMIGPILEVVGRVMFETTRWTGIMILDWAKAVATVWNAIQGALYDVMFEVNKTFKGALDGVVTAIASLRIDMSSITDPLKALKDATWESIDATEATTAAAYDATEAFNSFAESLTNVPTGWRAEAARYNAQNSQGGASVIGTINSGATTTIIVQGSIVDAKGLIEIVEGSARSARLRRSGSPL